MLARRLLMAAGTKAVLPVTDGLHAHYDAPELTYNNNDPVDNWPDLSGNDHHLTQPDSSLQPTFEDDGLGGLPVVRFSPTEILQTPTWPELAQPNYLFLVARFDDDSNLHIMVDGLDSSARNQFALDSPEWRIFAGEVLAVGTADTDPHLFAVLFDGSDSAVRIDASDVGSGDVGDLGTEGITLGASQNESFPVDGVIGEVLLFDRALSPGERDQVESHLLSKWGIV